MNILCILDGFGLCEKTEGNAVYNAKKPTLDYIFDKYNMVHANASGTFVGLPSNQMGNSEVGHLNIGSGRIIYQDLLKISNDIKDGTFYKREELLNAIKHCKDNNSNLHILGLLSDGGVHSHNTHLYALLKLCKMQNFDKVFIHVFLDGRDTPPMSGKKYLIELSNMIKEIGIGTIKTISGRYYAMDRDKNYDRIKKCYDCLTKNIGNEEEDVIGAIENSYKNEISDEFVLPTFIKGNSENEIIKDNDAIIFYNFRPDRARQITRCFVDNDFNFFDRKKLENLFFVCFTNYDDTIKNVKVVYKDEEIKNTLGKIISDKGLKQVRIAETEKYAHVTFFFNGGVEVPYKNEDRILVPSRKDIKTYDLAPEMSAREVCDKVLECIDSEKYDFMVVNFANPDMVGHTGDYNATIKAIETVDECIKKIYDKIIEKEYNMFICADHGNSEKMLDENGNKHTAHTNNKVPFVLVNNKGIHLKEDGSLCDIAPTMLELMNIKIPKEMTGKSLLIKEKK